LCAGCPGAASSRLVSRFGFLPIIFFCWGDRCLLPWATPWQLSAGNELVNTFADFHGSALLQGVLLVGYGPGRPVLDRQVKPGCPSRGPHGFLSFTCVQSVSVGLLYQVSGRMSIHVRGYPPEKSRATGYGGERQGGTDGRQGAGSNGGATRLPVLFGPVLSAENRQRGHGVTRGKTTISATNRAETCAAVHGCKGRRKEHWQASGTRA
jgi:hypothetical protein